MRNLVLVGVLLCMSLTPTWFVQGSSVPDRELSSGPPTETRAVTATVGQTVTVEVNSNPSTGYRWRPAGPVDESIVTLAGSQYNPPAKQLLGAGGTETWRFKAVGPGRTSILLEYVRPWEKKEGPARRVVVQVIVK